MTIARRTPMMSVKNADANTTKIVTVMKNIVGPFWVEPVRFASQCMAFRTGKRRKSVQPTQMNKIHRAVRPDPALTSATLSASNIQPTMSFPTPAERTTIPTVVSRSFSSVRIRHKTGNAVMEYATPVKSMKSVNLTLELINVWYNGTDKAAPSPAKILVSAKSIGEIFGEMKVCIPKGKHIPARAMVTDVRALRLIIAVSISRPTRNKNKHSPMLAVSDRYGLESSGKMCSVKPGIRPKAVGPREIV